MNKIKGLLVLLGLLIFQIEGYQSSDTVYQLETSDLDLKDTDLEDDDQDAYLDDLEEDFDDEVSYEYDNAVKYTIREKQLQQCLKECQFKCACAKKCIQEHGIYSRSYQQPTPPACVRQSCERRCSGWKARACKSKCKNQYDATLKPYGCHTKKCSYERCDSGCGGGLRGLSCRSTCHDKYCKRYQNLAVCTSKDCRVNKCKRKCKFGSKWYGVCIANCKRA